MEFTMELDKLTYADLVNEAKRRFEQERREYAIERLVELMKERYNRTQYAAHVTKEAKRIDDDIFDLLSKEVGTPPLSATVRPCK